MILMLGIVKQICDMEDIWYATLKGVKIHRFRIAALDKELVKKKKQTKNQVANPVNYIHTSNTRHSKLYICSM